MHALSEHLGGETSKMRKICQIPKILRKLALFLSSIFRLQVLRNGMESASPFLRPEAELICASGWTKIELGCYACNFEALTGGITKIGKKCQIPEDLKNPTLFSGFQNFSLKCQERHANCHNFFRVKQLSRRTKSVEIFLFQCQSTSSMVVK